MSGVKIVAGQSTNLGVVDLREGVPLSGTVTNTYGQTLYARVRAISNAGVEGPASPNSTGTILLDPNGDYDGEIFESENVGTRAHSISSLKTRI